MFDTTDTQWNIIFLYIFFYYIILLVVDSTLLPNLFGQTVERVENKKKAAKGRT